MIIYLSAHVFLFNRNSVESHWNHMMFQLIPGPKWLLTCLHAMSATTSSLLIILIIFLSDFLTDTLSRTVIEKLSVQFARHGIPDIFMSDNGPQFINDTFKCFMKKWNIRHVTSSPRYPQSNGKVENAVETCKMLMKMAEKSRSDICLVLLDYRNTPQKPQALPQLRDCLGGEHEPYCQLPLHYYNRSLLRTPQS